MSRPLKILYLDTETVWRGGQEQLLSLMTGMAARGHRVVLGTPEAAPLGARARTAGIPTVDFRQRGELSLRAFGTLRRTLQEGRVEVIHSNTPRSIAMAALAAAIQPLPPILIASRRVIFPLRSRLSALKYNRCLDSIICVCESIRNGLIEGGVKGSRVRTVYEGVDLSRLDAVSPASDLPIGHSPVVGTLGAMTPEKGHATLLSAFSRIAQRFPEALLVFIGDGPCKTQLMRQARAAHLHDRVHFAGFRQDSVAVLKRLQVFCLPSLSEGLSSALLEAMGCALPVVATAVGGNRELVVEGETGFLAPPGESAPLAQALERLCGNAEARSRMGASARRRIGRHFTLEGKLIETERIYLELLDSRGIG